MPARQEGLLRASQITARRSSSSSNLRLIRLQAYRFLLATFILLPFTTCSRELEGLVSLILVPERLCQQQLRESLLGWS